MGGLGGGPAGAGQWPPPGAFGTPAAGQRQEGAGAGAGVGAGTGAGATTTGTGGAGAQQPPFNPFAAFGGAGGQQPGGNFDPMAFLNTPLGQQAMQQMMAGGGPGGAAGMGGMPPGMAEMFGGMGGGAAGGASAAPADTRSPEERYEVQLGQLASMGFTVSHRLRFLMSVRS